MSQGGFTVEALPRMRQLVIDIGWFARQTDPIIGLIEIDVTETRHRLHAQTDASGEHLSFTAFLVACVAQAVDKHKEVQAIRDWRGRLVIFDDVDMTTMIEIEAEGRKTPVGRIIRAANHKTVHEIHAEIRHVQATGTRSTEAEFIRYLVLIPRFIRQWLFRGLYGMPHRLKALRGTVVLTSVGMFGKQGGWAVALPSHSLVVLIGGIATKPGVVNGQICIREYLHVTLAFDHRIVDGAPAARFAADLQALIENGYGLADG